jgi:hypothetical protein
MDTLMELPGSHAISNGAFRPHSLVSEFQYHSA